MEITFMDIIEMVYASAFIVAFVVIFRIKYLLKKHYLDIHNELFGNSLVEFSPRNSLRIARFTLLRSEWKSITNQGLIYWLLLYRVLSIFIYIMILFAVLYFLGAAVYSL